MGYAENKERSKTLIIGNTVTDQSGAPGTDINVIVKKMQQTGSMPTGSKPPMWGADLSEIPDNLRDMLEMSRNIEAHRNELPKELQGLSTAELINTPPKRLNDMMTEQKRYNDRHAKLPDHFKNLPRSDVLNLTDEQLTNMVTPTQTKPSGDTIPK